MSVDILIIAPAGTIHSKEATLALLSSPLQMDILTII
jgi:hypothetical protein